MIKNIKIVMGALFAVVFMYACNGVKTNKQDVHNEELEEHHEENENIVSLTEQQINTIGLNLVSVTKMNMSNGLKVTGMLELSPQDKADISPILGGVVNKLYVFEGDVVKKGQILLTLSNPDFIQLQQDYITNLHELTFKEQEFNRQKRLYEEKVGSGREFQKITSEYRTTKSILGALKVKLKMLGLNVSKIEKGVIFETMNVVSPINGIVSLVETNIGAYVEPLSKVFEIVDNDKVHADFMVYEKDISKVKIGQKVIFKTSSLEGELLESEIYAISPALERNPKAAHIHSKIKTKHKILTSGMYIQGTIIVDSILTNVLPEEAIIKEEEKTFIFVKKQEHEEDNHNHDNEHEKTEFEQIEVITGLQTNGFIEVKFLEPLPNNTIIAGNGAYYLLAEKGKGETEHSH